MATQVAVIIPCYNHGQYLSEAIASVEKYPDRTVYEMIIVDDGSTDPFTIEVIDDLCRKGYQVIRQKNQGLAAARNNAIATSQSPYFLPLDADNKIRISYIDKGISLLDSLPEVGIVYGDAQFFGEKKEVFRPGPFDLQRLLNHNFIDACAVLRKELWQKAGGYDPAVPALSDWDMNLCAVECGYGLHYVPEILYDYRVLGNSMIHTYGKAEDYIKYIARKHGVLYRQQFLESLSLTKRAKSLVRDLTKRLLGKK